MPSLQGPDCPSLCPTRSETLWLPGQNCADVHRCIQLCRTAVLSLDKSLPFSGTWILPRKMELERGLDSFIKYSEHPGSRAPSWCQRNQVSRKATSLPTTSLPIAGLCPPLSPSPPCLCSHHALCLATPSPSYWLRKLLSILQTQVNSCLCCRVFLNSLIWRFSWTPGSNGTRLSLLWSSHMVALR